MVGYLVENIEKIKLIKINGKKLNKFITPPHFNDAKLERFMHSYTIQREKVNEYLPRKDCSSCMANYRLAKRLNKTRENVILLVKRTDGDEIGDIIGIEAISNWRYVRY